MMADPHYHRSSLDAIKRRAPNGAPPSVQERRRSSLSPSTGKIVPPMRVADILVPNQNNGTILTLPMAGRAVVNRPVNHREFVPQVPLNQFELLIASSFKALSKAFCLDRSFMRPFLLLV